MLSYIEERVRRNGAYIVETGCTVRTCAERLGASKSTVHKDVTERLAVIDPELGDKVKEVLGRNLKERHLRGGDATKRKYEARRERKKGN